MENKILRTTALGLRCVCHRRPSWNACFLGGFPESTSTGWVIRFDYITRFMCARRMRAVSLGFSIMYLFNSYTTNRTMTPRRGCHGNKFVFIKNFRNRCRQQQGLGKNTFRQGSLRGCAYTRGREKVLKNKIRRESRTFSREPHHLGVFFFFVSSLPVNQLVVNAPVFRRPGVLWSAKYCYDRWTRRFCVRPRGGMLI